MALKAQKKRLDKSKPTQGGSAGLCFLSG